MTSASLTSGLTIRGSYSSTNASGTATIGSVTTHSLTAATIGYGISVTAAAPSNVATLTFSTGDVAQTTGSPVIAGAGADFEGTDLGTMTKVHGLRVRTSGTGTVTLAGSAAGMPDIELSSGADFVIKFPSGLSSPGTLALTFSATGGIAELEVLAE